MGNWFSLTYRQRKEIRHFIGDQVTGVPINPFSHQASELLDVFVQKDGKFSALGWSALKLVDSAADLGVATTADGALDQSCTEFAIGEHFNTKQMRSSWGAGVCGSRAQYESGSFISLVLDGDIREYSLKERDGVLPERAVATALEGKPIDAFYHNCNSVYIATALVMCNGIVLYTSKDKVSTCPLRMSSMINSHVNNNPNCLGGQTWFRSCVQT
eukprot:m.40642 g.40642  ORF g.40642 m.40642 type:complete len:215 (+) comp14841_c0_seq4:326-970(+)